MEKTAKSLRLHLGLFGRTNVGKSSFLNLIAAQDIAITSSLPGTTTDIVEKTMELLPLGPVVFLDTAGINDSTNISELRIKKTKKAFDRSDFIILIAESGIWTEFEEYISKEAAKREIPLIIIANKADLKQPSKEFLEKAKKQTDKIILASSIDRNKRDEVIGFLKECLIELCPDEPPSIMGDLLSSGELAVLIVPIDKEAPKGRLILPQVQVIRNVLDNNAMALVVKENEYRHLLEKLKTSPKIAVCDSQVVLKMVADTPSNIQCTTFSILFAHYKGDLIEMAKGVAAVQKLKPNDKVLIAEACTHHAIEDDIGRVKIPLWLKQYVGADLKIDICSGRDYPQDLKKYKLIIHCGSCMLTRRETLFRIHQACLAGVPITNYGLCISFTQGVIKRVLEPFPEALQAYKQSMEAD